MLCFMFQHSRRRAVSNPSTRLFSLFLCTYTETDGDTQMCKHAHFNLMCVLLISLQVKTQTWQRLAQAVWRSRAFGSVSSTSRSTTSSSCSKNASSSCARHGLSGPWLSSGTTSKGWKRLVLAQALL